MQLLMEKSEEGKLSGLGFIKGECKKFNFSNTELKVPHMGWSCVTQTQKHPMWNRISDKTRFYFAHSYYCIPSDQSVVTGTTQYGQDIAVSVAYGKLFACQFHPEKSSTDGLQFLENFTRWQGDAN